jgi:hypothetical protein
MNYYMVFLNGDFMRPGAHADYSMEARQTKPLVVSPQFTFSLRHRDLVTVHVFEEGRLVRVDYHKYNADSSQLERYDPNQE